MSSPMMWWSVMRRCAQLRPLSCTVLRLCPSKMDASRSGLLPIQTWAGSFPASSSLHQAASFSSADAAAAPPASKKPSLETLEAMVQRLLHWHHMFFVIQMDHSMFHRDLVLENRIHGTTTQGALNYLHQMNKFKIWAHIKYSFIRIGVAYYSISQEQGVIKIKWQLKTMGWFEMLTGAFTKKLFRPENMLKHAHVQMEGLSYFYIDHEGRIYRHVLDNKEVDKDQELNFGEKLKEQVIKLANSASNPSASM